jgi:hypothetical protein
MKVVVNLDASTSDTFNLLKGEASIGAFAAACIKQQLEFLKGKTDDENYKSVRADEVHT